MFKIQNLTNQQAEFSLGRKLTDNTWQAYMTSDSRKHRNTVKHLFTNPEEKQKPQFTFSDIAKHAARKAQRRKPRKQDTDTPYRIAKLFSDTMQIDTELRKYMNIDITNLKAFVLSGKKYGDVDIFQVHNVTTELINRMTEGQPENVRLQISFEPRLHRFAVPVLRRLQLQWQRLNASVN